MVTSLLVLSLLAQASQDMQAQPDPSLAPYPAGNGSSQSAYPAPSFSPSYGGAPVHTKFRGGLEATALSMPSGTPGGSMDVYAVALPILAVDSGEDFGFELGAELRLRVFDAPPLQKDEDIHGLLRGRDWDETSDFGQILRSLRVGSESNPELPPIAFRAGVAELKTVGHGHLVSRYTNQGNPDYHPASASLAFSVGPTRTELFASDILAGRLFAGEVALDIGRLATPNESQWDRYHVALSAAHDFGLAGYSTPPITMAQLDADATAYRNDRVKVSGYLGGGARLLQATPSGVPSFGAEAGFEALGQVSPSVTLGGRLEGRKQGGGFRPGLFNATYELSRFSARGFSFGPIANEQLPDDFSGYAEFQVGYGPADVSELSESDMPIPPRIFGTVAAEYYVWGRLDGDVALSVRFPGNRGTLIARFAAIDALSNAPRFQGSGELRYRFAKSFYVVATGGTVFFPQADHASLVRGAFGSIGFGADFERR